MARVFISQPMRGHTKEEIKTERMRIKAMLADDDIITNYSLANSVEYPLWHLGSALQDLSRADKAVFSRNWKSARGCIIEHMACELYDIPIVEV